MANITYERGIKCKRCGEIYISINRFQSYILCQKCGSHIADFDKTNRVLKVTDNADIITIKVTHKFFKDIYKEVQK